MTTRNIAAHAKKCTAMLASMLVFACIAFPSTAFANKQLNAPTTVSDDIARVHVAKLDAETHEYVSGATLAIIDKETGNTLDTWVTEEGVIHEYEKGELVVERPYILREIQAPIGYSAIDDVEFVINKDEGKGLTIVSGTAGQYEHTSLNRITLYDQAGETEVVTTVTKTRPTSSNNSDTTTAATKAAAPQTGDGMPAALIVGLVAVALGSIVLLLTSKRKGDK